MFEQLSIFDCFGNPYKINKPIRLIELFAGVGSQAMALRDIGANFEHYRVVEWDKYAIASYNAIHGTNFPTIDITTLKGSDLGIENKLDFTYLLTYSFPCTDLSVAGKQLGMAEGSGTRSSLLWEVRRLLDECEELPQILLMENVPQVHSKANRPHFQKWLDFLAQKGYSNFWDDLNAMNYGVGQSRNRTFVVSILGDYTYKFPKPTENRKCIKDYLEPQVDEKYYINSQKAAELIDKLIKGGKLDEDFEKYKNPKAIYKPFDNAISYLLHSQDFVRTGFQEISPTLSARDYKDPKVVIEMDKLECLGNIYNDNWNTGLPGNVWNANKPSPTLTTMQGGGRQPMIVDVKKLGNLQEDKPHESQTVYSENGASQTITAGTHGYGMGYILESKIVAMRGRDPLNPSDRTSGNPNLEQTLEINTNNVANTLTTVQKDNMVLEVKQATKDGYIECEIGGVADLNYPDSKTRRGRVIEKGQICPTLTTENIPSVLEPWIWEIEGEVYLIRIRKLTPRECWRLMGFTDEDYEKAADVNSNTQLYKQAGNSIVKNVLMGIFSAMM